MVGRVAALGRVVSGALAAATLALVAAPASAAPVAAAASAAARPDLSGIWWIKTYRQRIEPADGQPVPFKPAGLQKYKAYLAGRDAGTVIDDTGTYCLPDGVVRASGSPFPFELVQSGNQLFFLYEEDRTLRIVNIGGKRTPDDDLAYTFMGESIAQWDGDTLVIETKGMQDRTVLDDSGIPHGEGLKTVERIRLTDGGKALESVVTIEDPEFFTKPWTVRFDYLKRPDVDIQEYVCGEPHRDVTPVMRGRVKTAPPVAELPPLPGQVAQAWTSPVPEMSRIWQRAPWRSAQQKPGEMGRNDGNGSIPAITEGWDDRPKMLQPKAKQLMQTYDAGLSAGFPPPTSSSSCDMDGFPAIIGLPNSWQMVHTKDIVYFLYSYGNQIRRVRMNMPHPKSVTPNWMGTSTGRWEGETLVILTTGLTDRSFLSWDGIPHSTDLKITERYKILPDGRLRLEMLLEDPKVLTGPWTVVKHYVKNNGMEEFSCSENNRGGGAPTE